MFGYSGNYPSQWFPLPPPPLVCAKHTPVAFNPDDFFADAALALASLPPVDVPTQLSGSPPDIEDLE